MFFLGAVGFTVVEQIFPAERGQKLRDQFSNLSYVLMYYVFTPFVMIWPTALVTALVQKIGPGFVRIDLDHFRLGIAALDWPVRNIILPFVPVFFYDFFYYWHHRLQHRSPVFWPIHRLHHTTTSLNAFGAFRIHWLEEPMRVFTMAIPIALIFNITAVQGAWIAFALGQYATFIHANIRLPLGPLTPVLEGPQLHRLHHSFLPEHIDRNYSAIFPVWDIIFGTYCAPRPGEWPVTGLAENESAGTVLQETVFPLFTWSRVFSSKAKQDEKTRTAVRV
jgi:sterol desaturase/sphingolipid hydroxylase (fatty acid hydroxylase superfamily)